jgi:hypothetical protein
MEDREIESKIKSTWGGMISRCTNPKSNGYKYYVKRGVCDEWRLFKNFKRDMLDELVLHICIHGIENTSIDRIDNDLGYSKENCRWATKEVQGQNKKFPHRWATRREGAYMCSLRSKANKRGIEIYIEDIPGYLAEYRKNGYVLLSVDK